MGRLRILEAADQPRAAVWEALEPYAEVTTVRDGACAYQLLCERKFDLALINLMLVGLDGLELLRRIKKRNLCPLVVLTSEFPDFQYARQGILYGAFDYLIRPLTSDCLMELILRAEQTLEQQELTDQRVCSKLVQAVGTEEIAACYDWMVQRFREKQIDAIQMDIRIRSIYADVIRQTFTTLPWLERFACMEDYTAIDGIKPSDAEMVCDFCRRQLLTVSRLVAALYPQTENQTMRDILQYMLNHIDEGFRQRDVADTFYMSSTTLSERFRSEFGCTYSDYICEMKMRRANYLVLHSDLKIYEISALLGYRDVNYFSKVFKQRCGIPLSQLRRQRQPDYMI